MFWKKKNLESKEFLELKKEISLIWIELDVLSMRYKRKVTKKQSTDEDSTPSAIDDGFDDLRKLNKEYNP